MGDGNSPDEFAAATSAWFTVEVGAWIRGQVRREIEGAAWGWGLEITTDESKGLLESVYRFTVRGPSDRVIGFMAAAERWFKKEVESHA